MCVCVCLHLRSVLLAVEYVVRRWVVVFDQSELGVTYCVSSSLLCSKFGGMWSTYVFSRNAGVCSVCTMFESDLRCTSV